MRRGLGKVVHEKSPLPVEASYTQGLHVAGELHATYTFELHAGATRWELHALCNVGV